MSPSKSAFDVVVLGAGAAGLFFAGEAARRGRRVVAIDHARKLGEKIRISGGGRCNFTNLGTEPRHFLSQNPKFAISALRSFTAQDFVARVEAAGIGWHEKALGQLFCDDSAKDIIDMLIGTCRDGGVTLHQGTAVGAVRRTATGFSVATSRGSVTAPSLVVATGGKSIPKIGASGFGYQLAEQFGLGVIEPRPALVPLTFGGELRELTKALSAIAVEARVHADPETRFGKRPPTRPTAFTDGFLFTHRGLSGPSILQISSFWREGGGIVVDLAPDTDVLSALKERRGTNGRAGIRKALAEVVPKRLVHAICDREGWSGNLGEWPDRKLEAVADALHRWRVVPTGSEGYRTAEVTLGGVNTQDLDSKTLQARAVPGLFFIGEVVDVTGWLGGYNFQWAWSSAYAAAQAV